MTGPLTEPLETKAFVFSSFSSCFDCPIFRFPTHMISSCIAHLVTYISKCQVEEFLKSISFINQYFARNIEAVSVFFQHLPNLIPLSFAFSTSILLYPSPILVDIFNFSFLSSRSLVCRMRDLQSVLHACRATSAVMRPLVRKLC